MDAMIQDFETQPMVGLPPTVYQQQSASDVLARREAMNQSLSARGLDYRATQQEVQARAEQAQIERQVRAEQIAKAQKDARIERDVKGIVSQVVLKLIQWY